MTTINESSRSTKLNLLNSHRFPMNLFEHTQDEFAHVAPFIQGLGEQKSALFSQMLPEKLSTQLQVNELTPSMQVPPFTQGLELQSSMFVEQLVPVKPSAQLQV